jgi:hypothetical protein
LAKNGFLFPNRFGTQARQTRWKKFLVGFTQVLPAAVIISIVGHLPTSYDDCTPYRGMSLFVMVVTA